VVVAKEGIGDGYRPAIRTEDNGGRKLEQRYLKGSKEVCRYGNDKKRREGEDSSAGESTSLVG